MNHYRRVRRLSHRPFVEALEARFLLSTAGWFDAPWRGFDTGTIEEVFGPNSINLADMDGDGRADAVIGNDHFGAPGISILRSLGGGTFDKPDVYPLPLFQTIGEATVADIDIDGKLDVVASIRDPNGQTKKVAYWRNNGDGTLAPRKEFATGASPMGLAIADFTGDGFPDVMTANFGFSGSPTTGSLLRHNGQTGAGAAFVDSIDITVGNGLQRVAAGDMNGDGRTDLAFGRSGIDGTSFGTLSILLNLGGGAFGAPTHHEAAPGATSYTAAVAVSDLDKDGDLDLVGGGYIGGTIQSGAVTIRRNLGDGQFSNAQRIILNAFTAPKALNVGDVNGDTFPDILAVSSNGLLADGWGAVLSNGMGRFRSGFRYESSKGPSAIAASDTDGDGDQDVLVVARTSAAMTVHLNPGNGVFMMLPKYPTAMNSESMDAADIDLDGDIDLVTSDDQVRIHENPGDGVFDPYQTYNPPINPADVRLRDLNADGYPDLLLGPDGEHPPYHFGSALNNGNGTFGPGTVTIVNSCGDGTIDAFDLDNDGDLDVALTEEGGCIGGDPLRIFIFRNNGAGEFTLANVLFPPGGGKGIAGADLNHDGNMDLISAVVGGMGVYLGNGDLTFKNPLVTGPGRANAPSFVFTLVDLNNDGDLDVATLAFQTAPGTLYVGVKLGNGNGTFGPETLYSASSVLANGFEVANHITSTDVNRDGNPDVIVVNGASSDVSLFLGNGDGTLGVHQRYGVGYSPLHAAVEDFTGDGIPDVVTRIGLPPAGNLNAIVMLVGLDNSPPVPPVDPPSVARRLGSQESISGENEHSDLRSKQPVDAPVSTNKKSIVPRRLIHDVSRDLERANVPSLELNATLYLCRTLGARRGDVACSVAIANT